MVACAVCRLRTACWAASKICEPKKKGRFLLKNERLPFFRIRMALEKIYGES